LGKSSNFIFCPLSEVDVLITDSNADPEVIHQFEVQGVEVIVVDAVADEMEASV
jgi:DeoR family ulaG and ulaABCDEF operon transcriptional repressor